MALSAMDETLVFFDLETTGQNPRRHPIMQLAAVAVNQALETVASIELKIRFREAEATRASLRKSHYSPWLWADEAFPPREAAVAFAAFLRRHATPIRMSPVRPARLAQLVAHNAAFDGPFLRTWYEKLGLFLPARYELLCTLQRARWHFVERPELSRPRNFQLATLCQYFDVPFHAANAHDALGDVTATVGLYRALSARNTSYTYRRHATSSHQHAR